MTSVSIHDGDMIAYGCEDGRVKIWNKNVNNMFLLEGSHSDRVWSVAFNHDGTKIASGGKDRIIKIWDVGTRKVIKDLTDDESVSLNTDVLSVAFNNISNKIVSGSKNSKIKIWDLIIDTENVPPVPPVPPIVLSGHTARVNSVRFSPDGTLFASGSEDGTVKLWNSEKNLCLATVKGYNGENTRGVWSVAFSPDGKFLVSGSGGREAKDDKAAINACIRVWGLSIVDPSQPSSTKSAASSPTPQATLTMAHEYVLSPGQSVHSVAFSPNGNMIAAGLHDNSVVVYDEKKNQTFLKGHTNFVNSVAFFNDNVLVSGSQDGSVKIWDLNTQQGLDSSTKKGGSKKTKRNKKTKRKTKKNRK